MDNAIDAVGDRGRVTITASVRGDSVLVRVADDGPGIPPDRREEALRPFTRLDAARNQDRGTGVGLGLSIAADVARHADGVVVGSALVDAIATAVAGGGDPVAAAATFCRSIADAVAKARAEAMA